MGPYLTKSGQSGANGQSMKGQVGQGGSTQHKDQPGGQAFPWGSVNPGLLLCPGRKPCSGIQLPSDRVAWSSGRAAPQQCPHHCPPTPAASLSPLPNPSIIPIADPYPSRVPITAS